MDNGFLTILFYLFIIIIFLSSLFKKKPRGTQGPTMPQRQGNGENPLEINSKASSKDDDGDDKNEILDEIENLFKNGNKNQSQPDRKETSNEGYPGMGKNKIDFPTPDEYSKWPGTTAYKPETIESNLKVVQTELRQIDSRIEQEAQNFEKVLNQKQEEDLYLAELKEKLNSPEIFKEYFVVSEIIGKPKALRR